MSPLLTEEPASTDRAARPLKQAVRRIGHAVGRSRVARLIPHAVQDRIRRGVIGMSVEEVGAVLDALDAAGVDHVVAGGWGVDALVGRHLRPHIDIDIVVPDDPAVLDKATAALRPLGFIRFDHPSEGGAWLPVKLIHRDAEGRSAELLPASELPERTIGTLGGRSVSCLSPELQMRLHAGYEPRQKDRADVAILCERFGLEPPPHYAPKPLRERVRPAVDWIRNTRETALIVPVPDAEPAIGPWRAMFDTSEAEGVPAHVTALYPFMPGAAIDDAVRARLEALAAGHDAFGFDLRSVEEFPGVMYLAPEPREPFVALTEAIASAWPDFQPYGGAFDDIVPHLTVVTKPTTEGEHIQAALERLLPISAHATELVLIERRRNGSWTVEGRFPLRPAG